MNDVSKGAVPRKKGPNDGSVVLRLPDAWLARADGLVAYLAAQTPTGIELTRSDALRAALAIGLAELERDAARAKKPARK
jgi:hypothetical protein